MKSLRSITGIRRLVSLNAQHGFGEGYLLPIMAIFAICISLLIPGFKSIFANGITVSAIALVLIAIAGSVWLSSQCFGDYLNLGIVIVFAVIWTFSSSGLLSLISGIDISMFPQEGARAVCLLSLYIYLHALILTIVNVIKNRRDGKEPS